MESALNFWLQSFGAVLSVSFFCRAKEANAPAHGTHQAALPLFRSCLCGNILQSVASLVARAFSSVFRVLRNSFSYPHFVCITHTQTVIAFGELWLHSLCNLQVNLRYAHWHKFCDDGKIRANEYRGKFICTMLSVAEFG